MNITGATAGPERISETVRRRVAGTTRPAPLLPRAQEQTMTPRLRAVLDELTSFVHRGFAGVTMAQLAAGAGCSLRTLYELAPTRDDLVLLLVDRTLWSGGASAWATLDRAPTPVGALRGYLHSCAAVTAGWTAEFARDLSTVAATAALRSRHDDYLVDVTRALLDLCVEAGEIRAVDTAAHARVLGELGRTFTRPDVVPTLPCSPLRNTEVLLDTVLRGLT